MAVLVVGAIGLLTDQVRAQPSFPTRAEHVRIFVRAETKGAPRLDLGVEDFEVREDGRRVDNFRLVRLGAETADDTQRVGVANADASDLTPGIALLVDDFLPVEQDVDFLREHLRSFIQELEGPRFLSLTTPAGRISAQGTTPDGLGLISSALDRLHASDQFRRVFFPSAGSPASPAEVRSLETSMRDARLAAFQAACASLSGVTGDRVVVLIASRTSSYSSQEGRHSYERMLEAVRPANARLFSVEYTPATTRVPLLPLTTQSAPADPTRSATNRQATNPQRQSFVVDPRPGSALDLSHAVAIDTGGFSTRATLAAGLAQVAVKAENQYLISYERVGPVDDRFHKLEVKVKKKGVEVAHRRGFVAR